MREYKMREEYMQMGQEDGAGGNDDTFGGWV